MAEEITIHDQNEDIKVSPAKIPKFFKIIFDPRSLRLRIPDEFMRMHGENMCSPVFLRVASGSEMVVELLIHSDGKEAWLQKGWPEFREFYGIGLGQFLVFEYNGNSMFDVLIFDMSACEIKYPDNFVEGLLDTNDIAGRKPEENADDSDNSVVFLEEIQSSKKNAGKREMKKRKTAESTVGKSSDRGTQNLPSHSETRRGLRSKYSSRNINHSTRRRRVSSDLKGECNGGQTVSDKKQQVKRGIVDKKSFAYQRATSFISNNSSPNPFTIVLLQPSYVSNRFIMCVPVAFAKANLPGPRVDLHLRVSDGRMWSIRCLIHSSSATLSRGWKAFAEDNDLKLGDACVFEVVKGSKLLWNVFIFCNK